MTKHADAKKKKKGIKPLKDTTRRAQQRAHVMYRHRAKSLQFGREDFRFRVLEVPRQPIWVDDMVTGASWLDEAASLTGSITLEAPRDQTLRLNLGAVVVCYVQLTGQRKHHELWRMRVVSPTRTAEDGSVSAELGGDLNEVNRNHDDFRYKKGKDHHKKGWRADEITLDICHDQGIKVREVPQATHYIERFVRLKAAPINAIRQAWEKEAKATGHRFVVEWRNGLVVRRMRYPAYLKLLGTAALSAQLVESRKAGWATAVTVHHTVGKKKKRHIRVTVRNEKAIKRYGYVHLDKHDSDAKTEAQARKYGARYLANHMQPKREVSFTHPGLPQVRRFDAILLNLPEVGFRQVCWVKSVQHNLSPGQYTMDLTMAFDDPFYDTHLARVEAKKAQAAAKRRRKLRTQHEDESRRARQRRHANTQRARQHS